MSLYGGNLGNGWKKKYVNFKQIFLQGWEREEGGKWNSSWFGMD